MMVRFTLSQNKIHRGRPQLAASRHAGEVPGFQKYPEFRGWLEPALKVCLQAAEPVQGGKGSQAGADNVECAPITDHPQGPAGP
jgi:hypothetical protein